MQPDEITRVAAVLDSTMVATHVLTGGYSHQTVLLTLTGGPVVVRFSGPDPNIEAAVMAAAAPHVPVPQVLAVLPAQDDARAAMVIEYVPGTLLSQVLARSGPSPTDLGDLGGDYPAPFVDGFRSGFAAHHPTDLTRAQEWEYLGRVLDMFALSDLVTRPAGNPIAEQAAERIRHWVTDGVPGRT